MSVIISPFLCYWRICLTRSVLLDKAQGSIHIEAVAQVQTDYGDHKRHSLFFPFAIGRGHGRWVRVHATGDERSSCGVAANGHVKSRSGEARMELCGNLGDGVILKAAYRGR